MTKNFCFNLVALNGCGPNEHPTWPTPHRCAEELFRVAGPFWTNSPTAALSARLPRPGAAQTPRKPPRHHLTASVQAPPDSRLELQRSLRFQKTCHRFWPRPAHRLQARGTKTLCKRIEPSARNLKRQQIAPISDTSAQMERSFLATPNAIK